MRIRRWCRLSGGRHALKWALLETSRKVKKKATLNKSFMHTTSDRAPSVKEITRGKKGKIRISDHEKKEMRREKELNWLQPCLSSWQTLLQQKSSRPAGNSIASGKVVVRQAMYFRAWPLLWCRKMQLFTHYSRSWENTLFSWQPTVFLFWSSCIVNTACQVSSLHLCTSRLYRCRPNSLPCSAQGKSLMWRWRRRRHRSLRPERRNILLYLCV